MGDEFERYYGEELGYEPEIVRDKRAFAKARGMTLEQMKIREETDTDQPWFFDDEGPDDIEEGEETIDEEEYERQRQRQTEELPSGD